MVSGSLSLPAAPNYLLIFTRERSGEQDWKNYRPADGALIMEQIIEYSFCIHPEDNKEIKSANVDSTNTGQVQLLYFIDGPSSLMDSG